MWHGYTYAGLLFLVEMLKSLIICQYYFINTVVGLEVRSALLSAIYRKVCTMILANLLNQFSICLRTSKICLLIFFDPTRG